MRHVNLRKQHIRRDLAPRHPRERRKREQHHNHANEVRGRKPRHPPRVVALTETAARQQERRKREEHGHEVVEAFQHRGSCGGLERHVRGHDAVGGHGAQAVELGQNGGSVHDGASLATR